MMSSPNHLTSGIEDAFSSNFPDFIPASLDYVPASPGKTYSSSSNSIWRSSNKVSFIPVKELQPDQRNEVVHTSTTSIPTLTQDFEIGNSSHVDNLEAELQEALSISNFSKKQMGNNHKIYLARFRITDLEHIINDIQILHQEDKESLLNTINELKISQEGPSDY
ncbi:hypothetical protein Tco_0778178 [Tanacetum coccineum]